MQKIDVGHPPSSFGHLQTWFVIIVLIGLADDEMTKAMTVETIQVLCIAHDRSNGRRRVVLPAPSGTKRGDNDINKWSHMQMHSTFGRDRKGALDH